jgi:hypothetical protein
MIRPLLFGLAAVAAGGVADPAAAALRPSGFAPRLGNQSIAAGPSAWMAPVPEKAWAVLAAADISSRQAARWDLARGLIARGRGAEARGVLEVMQADEADLGLVEMFQLATGAARAEAGDAAGALAALGPRASGADPLALNAEACAWRLWAFAARGQARLALDQLRCAMPALNERSVASRKPFMLAAARAGIETGRADTVRSFLRRLPADAGATDLVRGEAALALADRAGAQRLLGQVATSGTPAQQARARIGMLEAETQGVAATPRVVAAVDRLAFVWRGDETERRVLRLSYAIGRQRHDLRRTLASGAALLRHFPATAVDVPMIEDLRGLLAAGLSPGSAMSIADAAGLYWDYRDLAPAGAAGDFLVAQLADRLQEKGLYARAAELLRHQLLNRARDIAQGPLSARVASLFILAGDPAQALGVLRQTEATAYPDAMRWNRQRVEAVALYKMGRLNECMAVLQDVPDGAAVRAEIYWSLHNWAALAGETEPMLPSSPRLSDVEQAVVLRYAVALAMLGREAGLKALRLHYDAAFAGTRAATTFALLTGDVAKLDPEMLTRAMVAIPSASPAGVIGNLLDAPLPRLKV